MILQNLFHRVAKQPARATATQPKKTYYVMSPGTTLSQLQVTSGKPRGPRPSPVARMGLITKPGWLVAGSLLDTIIGYFG